MRILIVNNLFGDNARGGAEKVVRTEARSLMSAGHTVAVLRTAPEDGQAEWHGVQVISRKPAARATPYQQLGNLSLDRRLAWHIGNVFGEQTARRMMRAVTEFRPDVVHTHNLMGVGFRLPRMLRRAKIRQLHTLHDVQLLHPSGLLAANRSLELSWWAGTYARLTARALGSPDVVVSPSRFLLDQHLQRGFFRESQTDVLANPVSEKGCVDRTNPAKPIFLFAGQLESHKGIELLLKAWDGWAGSRIADLHIAGSGRLLPVVKEAANRLENVSYLGQLSSDDLHQAYRRSAYLVLPSLVIENSPMSAAESLINGAPVVAARSGGLPEMVIEGETGFLFVPGDDCAMRDAMDRALAAWQGNQWTGLSAKAHARGLTMTTKKHTERLHQLMQKK